MTRFVYLDESGVANPAHEPWLVVAGIVIDADRQWRQLEERLSALADTYAPPEKRDGFVFHAKELWSGGKVIPRESYPAARRWEALKTICALPAEFQFPVVFGAVHRGFFRQFMGGTLAQTEVTVDAQVYAFGECLSTVEYYMRQEVAPDEVATITVEYNPHTYKLFRKEFGKLKKAHWIMEGMINPAAMQYWPITRIVDSVSYCEKHDTSLLQIADACAFIIRKGMEQNPQAQPYLDSFSAQLMGFRPHIGAEFVKAPA
jgi:hypothetical protein